MMVLSYKKWGLIVEKEKYQFRGTTSKCEVGVVHIHFHGIGVSTNTSDSYCKRTPVTRRTLRGTVESRGRKG